MIRDVANGIVDIACVHFPHHCPCAWPNNQDKFETGEGHRICVSKGGFKPGEPARKGELARKGMLAIIHPITIDRNWQKATKGYRKNTYYYEKDYVR